MSSADVGKVFIYGLYCPVSGELRYIGKANNVQARLKSHLKDANTRKTPVYSWIRSLAKTNQIPVIKVIKVSSVDSWCDDEKELIASHRATSRLLNIADGGDQPFQTTEQRRLNAQKTNAILASQSEREKEIRLLKQKLGLIYKEVKNHALKTGDWCLAEKRRLKMVYLYDRRPDIFGCWGHLKNVSHVGS